MLVFIFLLSAGVTWAYPSIGVQNGHERDDAVSRKVLGSSVVTSVSVIMDTGSEKHYSDAVGKPQSKPAAGTQVASPINLLNPDRYEFYTFNDSGELVKRLMTLSEIQGIIANADGEAFNQNSHSPENKVNDVVSNVQNVLKGEMEKNQNTSNIVLDTPDVSSSWSAILPAIFGNSGEEIKPVKPQTSMTPETIMLEHQTVPIVKKPEPFTRVPVATIVSTTRTPITTTRRSRPTTTTVVPTTTEDHVKSRPSTYRPSTYKGPSSTLKPPTTTRKPIKPSKRVTVRTTTPTTAIPRITTRGTRPNFRRTTTSTTTTPKPITTTPAVTVAVQETEGVPIERVKHTTSSTTIGEASSHFIQLFDPIPPLAPPSPQVSHYTKLPPILATRPTAGTPIGAVFIIDEKTNTRIPITTKEQLASFLNKLESTTELFKNASPNPNGDVPLIFVNTLGGQNVEDNLATTSNIQSTTTKIDDDRYQQLLLTSTNIYEINKELAKSTTVRPPSSGTIQYRPTSQAPLVTSHLTDITHDILSSTIKEPNLVNSIEQLIQQAVGNIQDSQKETTRPNIKITTISAKTTTTAPTTITEIPESTTTNPTTTEVPPSSGYADDAMLSEAMDSLLSQVVSSNFQGLTTLQELPSTTEILNKPLGPSGESLEFRIKTTDIFSETTDSTTDPDEIKSTTDWGNQESKISTFGNTYFNEILKTDASTYSGTSDTTDSGEKETATGTEKLESTTTDGGAFTSVTESTTEAVKDLPIVFDIGLNLNSDLEENTLRETVQPTDSTTEETKVTNELKTTTEPLKVVTVKLTQNSEQTLEKIIPVTTGKPIDSETGASYLISTVPTTENRFEGNIAITTDEQVITTTVDDKNLIGQDSESVPSTNSYKEVTHDDAATNENTVTYEQSAQTGEKETTTLSIEQLLKELTTRNDNGQNDPKETTVLIITKPLYSTTPRSTTTTTTTTTVAPVPELTAGTSTELPTSPFTQASTLGTSGTSGTSGTLETLGTSGTTLSQAAVISENTEAIAADAIAADASETTNLDLLDSTSTVPSKEPEWTIVSTIAPHTANITNVQNTTANSNTVPADIKLPQPPKPVDLVPMPQLLGLEETTKNLDHDIYQFVGLCNELAFGFWKSVTTGISSARSVVLSPFAATSLLAMVFLGARGATSGEMNEILRLDDMVTFNPHLIFKNVSESLELGKRDGVATSVILRELYSDKSKGHLLNFYKERAKAFYDGHVEEVSFKEVGDVIRRRTNLIVKKQTNGKIQEYIKDSSITVKSPLAGVSASIFQTDCSDASVEGRDGELYFVVLPSIRQRRLVPVPAAVWRTNFLAGYDPGLDATAVALGSKDQIVSTIFVIPGQQGIAAPGDGLARLERHLIGGAFKDKSWSRLLQTLIPRPGLEVQIPRFQHRSVINATVALQQMGMKDLFDAEKADLRGLNGVANDLYLSDILQINNFATCGEEAIADTHHSEIYPATANRTYRRSRKFKDLLPPEGAYYDSELSEEPRDYQRAFHDPLHDPSLYSLPLPLRPRQARLPDPPRLRFDRPFLYFVRHNPTGLILHMGRFNPRLLP